MDLADVLALSVAKQIYCSGEHFLSFFPHVLLDQHCSLIKTRGMPLFPPTGDSKLSNGDGYEEIRPVLELLKSQGTFSGLASVNAQAT